MTPQERASGVLAYVNAVGFEDGAYGGPGGDAWQRLHELIAEAVSEAEKESSAAEREAIISLIMEVPTVSRSVYVGGFPNAYEEQDDADRTIEAVVDAIRKRGQP